MWGLSATNAWAWGGTNIVHWDGVSWTSTSSGFGAINDMSGTSPNDLWAVGSELMHFNGVAWTALGTPTAGAFLSVVAEGPQKARLLKDDAMYSYQIGGSFQPVSLPGFYHLRIRAQGGVLRVLSTNGIVSGH